MMNNKQIVAFVVGAALGYFVIPRIIARVV